MKPIAFSLIALAGLAACDASMSDATPVPLTTQAELSAIVGRTLTFQAGQSFVLNPDGTMIGTWDGAPLVGTYEMRDGLFCRELTEFVSGPRPEDCMTFVLVGDEVRVTRTGGAGFTYTVS